MVQVKHLDIRPGVLIPTTLVKALDVMTDGTVRIFYDCDVPPDEPVIYVEAVKELPGNATMRLEKKERSGGAKEK